MAVVRSFRYIYSIVLKRHKESGNQVNGDYYVFRHSDLSSFNDKFLPCNQVFILVDKPNEELDALLSDHIMNLHANRDKTHHTTIASFSSSKSSLASQDGPGLSNLIMSDV